FPEYLLLILAKVRSLYTLRGKVMLYQLSYFRKRTFKATANVEMFLD
ncbi:hypothetical protein SAMN05216364_10361, partial [Porphyromonadaceae bacterium KHP3R9]